MVTHTTHIAIYNCLCHYYGGTGSHELQLLSVADVYPSSVLHLYRVTGPTGDVVEPAKLIYVPYQYKRPYETPPGYPVGAVTAKSAIKLSYSAALLQRREHRAESR